MPEQQVPMNLPSPEHHLQHPHHSGVTKKSGWFKKTLLTLAAIVFGVTVYDDIKNRRKLKRLKK